MEKQDNYKFQINSLSLNFIWFCGLHNKFYYEDHNILYAKVINPKIIIEKWLIFLKKKLKRTIKSYDNYGRKSSETL